MKTRTITASDRSALIRLASSLPAGSPQRKAILAGLVQTKQASGEFNIPGRHVRGLESSTSRSSSERGSQNRSGSNYRMELFEEVEAFVERLQKEPDWKVIRSKMNDALHFMGRGEPFNDMEEALRQVTLAQAALEKAVSHLRAW